MKMTEKRLNAEKKIDSQYFNLPYFIKEPETVSRAHDFVNHK